MSIAPVGVVLNTAGRAVLEEALQAVRVFFRPLRLCAEGVQKIPFLARTALAALRYGLTWREALAGPGYNSYIPSEEELRLYEMATKAVETVRHGGKAESRARSGDDDFGDIWILESFLRHASPGERAELWSLIYELNGLSHGEVEARHFQLIGRIGVRLTVSRVDDFWVVERVEPALHIAEGSQQD